MKKVIPLIRTSASKMRSKDARSSSTVQSPSHQNRNTHASGSLAVGGARYYDELESRCLLR